MTPLARLTLSDPRPLPDCVLAEGREWRVRPQTRVVLRVARMLSDGDLAPWHRAELLARWFYAEGAPRDAITPFLAFLRMGREPPNDTAPPDFDYEQDAAEIASSFQQLYGIDLFSEGGELHWWRFQALLTGCFAAECALSAKVRLRRTPIAEGLDAALCRAIEAVQLEEPRSEADLALERQVWKRLEAGAGIEDLVTQGGEG